MPKFSELLFGKSPKPKKIETLTPQQQAFQNQLISGLGGPQQSGLDFIFKILSGDQEAISQFQAPALRQFNEQIVPGITERFGGLGALRSSGFQNSLANAASGLAENLSAQKAGLGFNALSALQNFYQPAFQPQFQTGFLGGTTGVLPGAISGFAQGAGSALGNYFGGGLGSVFKGGMQGLNSRALLPSPGIQGY